MKRAAAGSLLDALLDRIRRDGSITFAEFMEVALYDPEHGFYARAPIGREGHFVTSPHVSPAFGGLLARQLAECWEHLGRPDPYTVVELGAGDGTLARQILRAVVPAPELAAALRYVAVERTPQQVAELRNGGLETAGSVREVAPFTGCVIANELLDNVPFHRLRNRGGTLVEVLVGADRDGLIEVEGEPAEAVRAEVVRPLSEGEERPVSPQAIGILRDVAAALERGYVLLFDYGFVEGASAGPVHAYRDHRVEPGVLDEPGSRDVTAAVDLASVAAEAERCGLQAWGPVTQREALLALGYRLWDAGVRGRQGEVGGADAARLFAERSRASILIDPARLGGLFLLALGTPGLPPPAALRGDRDRGC